MGVTVTGSNVAGGPARLREPSHPAGGGFGAYLELRITVLWIFVPVCQTAGVYLPMFEPGVIRDMMAGKVLGADIHSAGTQINTALFWLAPMALAYLTLVLKDTANRRTNAVAGAVTTVTGISLLIGQQAGTSAGVNFVLIVVSLVALLIVWHAWKWPRPAEVTPSRQSQETTRAASMRSAPDRRSS